MAKSYVSLVGGEKIVSVSENGRVLSPKDAFNLAQYEDIEGELYFSAKPAELGLRITTKLPVADIELIGRPANGEWGLLSLDSNYAVDSIKIGVVPDSSKHQLSSLLETLGLVWGLNNFGVTAKQAWKLVESAHCEFREGSNSDLAPHLSNQEPNSHVLHASLHDYQLQSVALFSGLVHAGVGGLLADDMGLGKTLQAISIALDVVNRGGQVLVVVPSILIPNWIREIAKFAPTLKAGVHHANYQRFILSRELEDFDVVVTAYSTISGQSGDVDVLSKIEWELLIADEAQFIKNPEARRTEFMKRIPRKAGLALTGTPLENSPLDLWSIGDFIFPGMFGDKEEFDTDLEISDDAQNLVTSVLKPVMVRRTLSDVNSELKLPERLDRHEPLRMPNWMLARQDEILESDSAPIAKFGQLIELACHAQDSEMNFVTESPKLERLGMLIEHAKAKEEKVIVFARYIHSIERISSFVGENLTDFSVFVLNGSSGGPEERQNIVDRFSNQKNGLLVANPDAAGFGLNITSANHVIHFHPLWNPAKSDQATRRAHRPGQERVTYIHHFFYESSVEEFVLERQNAKRSLADSVLQGQDLELSQADISSILGRLIGG